MSIIWHRFNRFVYRSYDKLLSSVKVNTFCILQAFFPMTHAHWAKNIPSFNSQPYSGPVMTGTQHLLSNRPLSLHASSLPEKQHIFSPHPCALNLVCQSRVEIHLALLVLLFSSWLLQLDQETTCQGSLSWEHNQTPPSWKNQRQTGVTSARLVKSASLPPNVPESNLLGLYLFGWHITVSGGIPVEKSSPPSTPPPQILEGMGLTFHNTAFQLHSLQPH